MTALSFLDEHLNNNQKTNQNKQTHKPSKHPGLIKLKNKMSSESFLIQSEFSKWRTVVMNVLRFTRMNILSTLNASTNFSFIFAF